MLKCNKCGNTNSFSVGVKEYHRHHVDGDGDCMDDLGTSDNDRWPLFDGTYIRSYLRCNDYQCMKCDSWDIVELNKPSRPDFTVEPWSAHNNNSVEDIDIDAGCERIASISLDVSGITFDADKGDTPRAELERRMANARLIAAAPKLYQALEDLLNAQHENHTNSRMCNQARAALREAREGGDICIEHLQDSTCQKCGGKMGSSGEAVCESCYLKDAARRYRDRALSCVQMIIDSGSVDGEDVVVRDTIANLMHHCEEKGIDFHAEVASGIGHYEAEERGED